MGRAKLDTSRPYATSYGTNPGCAFSQDGKKFDGGGLEIIDEDQQATVPHGLRNADERRQALIDKAFAEQADSDGDAEKHAEKDEPPATAPDTSSDDGDQQEDPPEKNINDKLSDVYKTRQMILDALDGFGAQYNKNERKSVLLDRLKTAIEKKEVNNA